jgi:hypothetical protein
VRDVRIVLYVTHVLLSILWTKSNLQQTSLQFDYQSEKMNHMPFKPSAPIAVPRPGDEFLQPRRRLVKTCRDPLEHPFEPFSDDSELQFAMDRFDDDFLCDDFMMYESVSGDYNLPALLQFLPPLRHQGEGDREEEGTAVRRLPLGEAYARLTFRNTKPKLPDVPIFRPSGKVTYQDKEFAALQIPVRQTRRLQRQMQQTQQPQLQPQQQQLKTEQQRLKPEQHQLKPEQQQLEHEQHQQHQPLSKPKKSVRFDLADSLIPHHGLELPSTDTHHKLKHELLQTLNAVKQKSKDFGARLRNLFVRA